MPHPSASVFREVTGSSIGWAVVMIFLGFMAILLSLVTGIDISVVIAWVIFLSGLAYAASAFSHRIAGAFLWRLLIGVVYIAGGGYLVFHPQFGLEALPLFVAVIFAIESILEVVTFFQFRLYAGSVWALFDGVITLMMAFLILLPWPNSSSAIGAIVGINLIVTGIAVLMYSLAARKSLEALSR